MFFGIAASVLFAGQSMATPIRKPMRMRCVRGIPDVIANEIKQIEEEPFDKDRQFSLIFHLTDEHRRQIIILMHEKQVRLPLAGHLTYQTGRGQSFSGGGFSGQDMTTKLKGTGLLEIDSGSLSVRLTTYGHEFAEWLVKVGKKADFLVTPVGGWGEAVFPKGLPPSPFPNIAPSAQKSLQEEMQKQVLAEVEKRPTEGHPE